MHGIEAGKPTGESTEVSGNFLGLVDIFHQSINFPEASLYFYWVISGANFDDLGSRTKAPFLSMFPMQSTSNVHVPCRK